MTTASTVLTTTLRKLAAAVAVLAWGAAAVAAAPTGAGPMMPTIDIDRPVVLAGKGGPVYILVRFAVPEEVGDDESERSDLNLALVLDRSGSMEARGKMEYLKRAAAMVVDKLKPRDRLAVVEYDDRITLLWPSAPVESPRMIKQLIAALTARGSTDLTGGMMRGVEVVGEHAGRDAIDRVLLLSDGLANAGITSPSEIRRLVRRAKKDGVQISTLGLGVDYNEDLMQDIAENAGGNYYFIEHPNQMAGIFQRELLALFHTVARNVDFEFRTADAVRGVEVFGFPSETAAGTTKIEVDDFYAGETRSMLLRLDIAARGPGRIRLGTVSMAYHDVQADRPREFVSEIAIDATLDTAAVDAGTNQQVRVEAALVEAETAHAQSVRLYQEGRRDQAREILLKLERELKASNATLADARIASKVEALEVERDEQERVTGSAMASKAYIKRSKQRLYQAQKGKRSLYRLQEGDQGFEVRRLQEAMNRAGYYTGPMDGHFGALLTESVKAYQRSEKLSVDGIAGPATLRNLNLY
jgi:Ca-activated chloride channel family protein